MNEQLSSLINRKNFFSFAELKILFCGPKYIFSSIPPDSAKDLRAPFQFTVLVHQTEDNGVFRRFFNCIHKKRFFS